MIGIDTVKVGNPKSWAMIRPRMAAISLLDAPQPAPSPTVERLRSSLRSGDANAVERFWRAIDAAHGPLVEPIPGDDRHRAVTFAWRGAADPAGRHVLLVARALIDRHLDDVEPALLEHVPGSDVWLRTYRLDAELRTSYCFVDAANPVPQPGHDIGAWNEVLSGARPDPANPERQPMLVGDDLSVLALPEAARGVPWERGDAPAGTVERHRLRSVTFGNERDVWIYTPPGEPYGPLATAVLLDGDIWAELTPIAPLLDRLIADGLIPPVCAVMVHPLDGETRITELGLHDALPAFLCYELLPFAARHAWLSEDPARTLIAGHSLGGVAAALAGLRAPERFGLVLSQSGSFHWPEDAPDDAEELARRFSREPRAACRVYAEVGNQEGIALTANRHMRDVLVARGYEIDYREYTGGHDYACWRASIADGLTSLLGTRRRQPAAA